MNNKVIGVVAFTLGAAVGSVATGFILKTKYEELVQEEIQSVIQMCERKTSEDAEETEEDDDVVEIEEADLEVVKEIAKEKMHDIINKQGYTNYAKIENIEEEEGEDDVPKPYVISPEEFDELDDYEVESLTYYADGILVDDDGVEIDDIDGLLGKGSLDTFGQYEDDSVFVRNDGLKTDYEILLDPRKYMDTLMDDE